MGHQVRAIPDHQQGELEALLKSSIKGRELEIHLTEMTVNSVHKERIWQPLIEIHKNRRNLKRFPSATLKAETTSKRYKKD